MAELPATQNPHNPNYSATLAAVKSPMIFNALAILIVAQLTWTTRLSNGGVTTLDWCIFGFIAVVTAWLNIFAAFNPRFLAYGPAEYIRESELAHAREMGKLNAGHAPGALPPA